MKTCLVEGCNNKYKSLGYCNKHYKRFKKYGNASHLEFEQHGMKNTPEYVAWIHLKSRCYNKNDLKYPRYGERGVEVCNRWLHSFINFYNDMGKKPFKKAQIDRINNDGNYEPDNCRWVTGTQNIRNSSATKLTMLIAKEIRLKFAIGNTNYVKLGKEYNVSSTQIGYIVKNKSWI